MEESKKKFIVYAGLFVTALAITVYQQYVYEKYNATWFGYNIYLWVVVLCPSIAIGMNFINYLIAKKLGSGSYFDHKRYVPSLFVFSLLTTGCLLSMTLGVTYTEPDHEWSSGHSEISQDARYQHSSFYQWYYVSRTVDALPVPDISISDDSSSSDDEAIELYAAIALALLIAFILLLSATVQHFWVVGSIAILLMMAQFLYRLWKNNRDEESVRKRFIHK